ncbi:MAG TPA: thiamine pyrophosphate-dependent dehydrogenase E1 component subunit alpha [Actinomycetota bacterium]|jgi:pyruvate dehydrogenase E1 component alpha subunit|nr:thiamine pyrophosphate-dependent dehydrogenase E1 component subunit alpha [Actinomycetota bacterium]
MDLTKDNAVWIYDRMVTIRAFEERVAKLFADGRIPGFVHLYAGEEAVAVGVCAHLGDRDYITSTHRGHGHCIAKGVPLGEMMAELFGKVGGSCKGKGGSMHIADVSRGMLGANGIVGGGPPLACGAGLTIKRKGTGGVVVCFFGDGAAEQGTTHEGMNLAAIWKLPVVFVAENNQFAESTPVGYHCAASSIADRAAAYNMPGVLVDGYDVVAVHEAAAEAVERARRGDGPSLIEAKTWRYFGHFEGDQVTYRTAEQSAAYREHDPLTWFARQAVDRGLLTAEEVEQRDRAAEAAVDEAIEFADRSPLPAPEEALTDVYVSYR